MNYQKIYSALVTKAKCRHLDGYKERHHIIPRCMGGADDKNNFVELTAREHFIAHRLLTKIYPNVKGLHYAVNLMRYNKGVKLTSRLIETLKIQNSVLFSGENNPRFGKPSWIKGLKTPEETKAKMRASHKGKVISEEAKANMSNARIGRFSGKNSPRYGLPNPRRGEIWNSYDSLYELWVYNNRPKRTKFNKIAVKAGYPNICYRRMIENFIRKEK